MKKFINMDFDGTQWWVEYEENGSYFKDYFSTEQDAQLFYNSIITNN
jgi:hypothetical protein